VSGSGSESANITLSLPDDVQIASDLTVAGNLTVNGTLTSLDTTNLDIEDNLFQLNAGLTGSPVNDSGMLINRGTADNGIFMWDESVDKFTLGLTTADGSATGNITLNSLGTLVANLEGNVTGAVTGTVSSLSNHDTDDLTEGSNLYYTQARFDSALAAKSTSNLSEGTNLYYTDARFDTRLASKDTDDVSEGTSNLYYTSARFDSAFGGKSTSDLSEGSNLYYTDARVQAISINNVVEDTTPQLGGDLDLNSSDITGTGDINITGTATMDGLTVDGSGGRQYINTGHLRLSDDYNLEWGGGTNAISGSNANNSILFKTNNETAITIDSSQRVGINTSSMSAPLEVRCDSNNRGISIVEQGVGTETWKLGVNTDGDLIFLDSLDTTASVTFQDGTGKVGIGATSIDGDSLLHLKSSKPNIFFEDTDDNKDWRLEATSVFKLQDVTRGAEVFRFDSSGILMVGTTDTDLGWTDGDDGVVIRPDGSLQVARSPSDATFSLGYFNRLNSDGRLLEFRKDGSEVGSIGVVSGNNLKIHSTQSGHSGVSFGTGIVYATDNAGDATNGAISLGSSSYKWKDLHLSGTVTASYIAASNSVFAGSGGVGAMALKVTYSGADKFTVQNTGNVAVAGALSKGSGSFKIDHPLESKKDTHHLVHSFVEAPQADNIYRGKVDLVDGSATVNIDTVAGMTEGTFVALNTDVQCFTTNESDWDSVKGSVSGNILTISCQNESSTATVSWLVIGERHDQHMKDTDWTDDNGKVIVEPTKW